MGLFDRLRGKKEDKNKLSRENAVEEIRWDLNLDQVIEYLEQCRKEGKSVYIEYGDAKLYSADVTIDSAYMAVHGCTKQQFLEKENRYSKYIQNQSQQDTKHNTEPKQQPDEKTIYFNTLDELINYMIKWNISHDEVFTTEYNGVELSSEGASESQEYRDSVYLKVNELTEEQTKAFKSEMMSLGLGGIQNPDAQNAIVQKYDQLKEMNRLRMQIAKLEQEKKVLESQCDKFDQTLADIESKIQDAKAKQSEQNIEQSQNER